MGGGDTVNVTKYLGVLDSSVGLTFRCRTMNDFFLMMHLTAWKALLELRDTYQ